jgi:hypothetical protein
VGPSVDVSEQQVLGLWGTAGLCFPVLCAKSSSLMVSFFIKNTSVNYRLKSLNILFIDGRKHKENVSWHLFIQYIV